MYMGFRATSKLLKIQSGLKPHSLYLIIINTPRNRAVYYANAAHFNYGL